METLLNEATNINEKIDRIISQGLQQYERIAIDYQDYKDEKREKLISDSRMDLTKRIKNQLEHLASETENLEDESLIQMQKTIYPKRSSKMDGESKLIGESEFRSALSLLNTRNENLILNELKKASMNFARNEFSFFILENINNFDLSDETINAAIEIMKKNDKIEFYLNYLKTKKEIEAIRDKINYHKRYLEIGTINKNYSLNRQIRKAKGNVI